MLFCQADYDGFVLAPSCKFRKKIHRKIKYINKKKIKVGSESSYFFFHIFLFNIYICNLNHYLFSLSFNLLFHRTINVDTVILL